MLIKRVNKDRFMNSQWENDVIFSYHLTAYNLQATAVKIQQAGQGKGYIYIYLINEIKPIRNNSTNQD